MTQIGSAPYSVTKSAVVSFAEWLSITATVEGLREERFLILPHPEVATYVRRKADDVERCLSGMRRLQARFSPDGMRSTWILREARW